MTAEQFIEQASKYVSAAQAATVCDGAPVDLRDLTNAYRDKMVLLQQLIHDAGELIPVDYREIPEFDAIPE